MPNRLLDTMTTLVAGRHMLKHPFYQAWNDGALTRDMLKFYACQYYHFVNNFPRMVSAVHSNTPDIAVRGPILRNLMDEELGSENHPALWMRFANAMGASEQDVREAEPLPTTIALVDTMMGYCRKGSFQEGLGSLYAYESQIPEVSRVKMEGLRKFYGLTNPDAIEFFLVHEEADVLHSREEAELIVTTTPAGTEPSVERAVEGTAMALWGFLDGVHEKSVAAGLGVC